MTVGTRGAATGTAISWQGAWSGIRRSCSGEDWKEVRSFAIVSQAELRGSQSREETGLHPSKLAGVERDAE